MGPVLKKTERVIDGIGAREEHARVHSGRGRGWGGWCAIGLVGLLAGCGPESGARLGVDVSTDAVPGIEFFSVRTEVFEGDQVERGLLAVRTADATATRSTSYGAGQRVASFQELRPGTYTLRVRLLRGDARTPLLSRRVLLQVQEDRVVHVALDRGCLDVECPSSSGASGATECVGGRCVEPSCVPPDPNGCDGLVLCAPGASCAVSAASCAEPTCVDGVCLALPVAGACEPDEYCAPDPTGGCRTLGEAPEDRCGTICTGARECEAGYWNCRLGAPFCDLFLRRPTGEACSAGVCDGAGRCVDCPHDAVCNVGCRAGRVRCSPAGAECVLDGTAAPEGAPCGDSLCVEGQPCAATGACARAFDGAAERVVCTPAEGAALVARPTRLEVAEGEAPGSFTVQLSTAPLALVEVALSVDPPAEVELSTARLVFDETSWAMPRVVEVRAPPDGVADGDVPFVVLLTASSSDTRFEGLTATVDGTSLDRAPRCGDGRVDEGEACDDGRANGRGCGLCLADCAGYAVAPGFEVAVSPPHVESDWVRWSSDTTLPPSQGGTATGSAWTVTFSVTEPPQVAIRATKPSTPGVSHVLFARVHSGIAVPYEPSILCGVEVRFRASLEVHSGFGGAGLRVWLVQRGDTRWVDSPRGSGPPGSSGYIETYIDVAAPWSPMVEGGYFFTVEEIRARDFDPAQPIYAGATVARSTVAASDSTVYFDDLSLAVYYDRDQDGICDDVDDAICGNGVREGAEVCDSGCTTPPSERVDCATCP